MKETKPIIVKAGNIEIGGSRRISVQTMWKRSLHIFSDEDLLEIKKLEEIGCDLLRFSVPDLKSAEILSDIKKSIKLPIVADIHFDHKIALKCIENGIDKVRINPGNIGAEWKVKEVLDFATVKNVPIRIGINTGSLPEKLINVEDKAQAMIMAAEEELEILEKNNFKNAVFSLKSSDMNATLKANRYFHEKYNNPLHLGITEAGPITAGIVKSSIAISELLKEGIGDTIRISLSDSPLQEVIAGREILKACGKSDYGVNIVSCPRCGRSTFDTHKFINEVYEDLYKIKKPIKAAVMGCIVNGPGEASDADIGITGAGKKAVIFKDGKIIAKVAENDSKELFIKLLKELD
ncbi:MAG: flavodoxin-dependent (E)-4-hydroxy-3-methylbut-2-enyl-diphosphate synthase [Spirochaetales bacterium]|nr:flavodoxin-dependent (E)-4-hydroxy-3-methylbut-2-enyl-diphosphate synthase [Spirochaetales bacterium]